MQMYLLIYRELNGKHHVEKVRQIDIMTYLNQGYIILGIAPFTEMSEEEKQLAELRKQQHYTEHRTFVEQSVSSCILNLQETLQAMQHATNAQDWRAMADRSRYLAREMSYAVYDRLEDVKMACTSLTV